MLEAYHIGTVLLSGKNFSEYKIIIIIYYLLFAFVFVLVLVLTPCCIIVH